MSRKKKNKNNILNLCMSILTLALCVLVVIGVFIPAIGSLDFGMFGTIDGYSIMNLFEVNITSYTLTAVFGLFTMICAIIAAVLVLLKLIGIDFKYSGVIKLIFAILTALFAILTFLMIPIDAGFDHIGDFFEAGMWLTFIPGVLVLPAAALSK